jgi:hypothetical protein
MEPFKNFRIGTDDTCANILPQALKKYGIEANWQQYALFITYGDKGSRCLYDITNETYLMAY